MAKLASRAPHRLSCVASACALALALSHCASDAGQKTDPPSDAGADARASDAGQLVDAHRPATDASGAETSDAQRPEVDAQSPQVDAGGADAETRASFATTPVSDLTYLGTEGGSEACTQSFHTRGFAPVDTSMQKHPLFLYFVGTAGSSADASARYDCQAGAAVTEAMARRGFVALSAEYDNQLTSIFTSKQSCLFDASKPDSLIAKACALPSVDCSLGIATWGHSQGALLAHEAANLDSRVRAVWTTGYSGLSGAKLAYSRFRTVNGEADAMNSDVGTANKTAGFTAADQCPADGRDSCLRADGSGWIIVRRAACMVTSADHCWFDKKSCGDNAETLEPNWSDRSSKALFALDSNADWVAATVARP